MRSIRILSIPLFFLLGCGGEDEVAGAPQTRTVCVLEGTHQTSLLTQTAPPFRESSLSFESSGRVDFILNDTT